MKYYEHENLFISGGTHGRVKFHRLLISGKRGSHIDRMHKTTSQLGITHDLEELAAFWFTSKTVTCVKVLEDRSAIIGGFGSGKLEVITYNHDKLRFIDCYESYKYHDCTIWDISCSDQYILSMDINKTMVLWQRRRETPYKVFYLGQDIRRILYV